ncbi:MAG: hypothetical protein ACO1Q7_20790, partial [Gemmatimonas sp.]
TANCELRTANCELRTANCELLSRKGKSRNCKGKEELQMFSENLQFLIFLQAVLPFPLREMLLRFVVRSSLRALSPFASSA